MSQKLEVVGRFLQGLSPFEIAASLMLAATILAEHSTSSYSQGMAVPGTFSVGAFGSAIYSVPIVAPPGTAGITPSLTLRYNSQQADGLVGMGWGLDGLAQVARCAQTIAQDGQRVAIRFDANDRFCLNGQRLVAYNGMYGADGTEYRTEIEEYSRVLSHGSAGAGPAWFEVHTKSGQILEL